MPNAQDYGDLPIEAPEQDLFGIDPFVRALARSLRGMKSPTGVVIALNGPWGSGKSSAINLLKHHLKDAIDSSEMETISFNPWWFRGEEALVLAFFRELYTATKPSLGKKAKQILPKLGARLLKAGGVVAPIADAAGAAGAGQIASGVMTWLGDLIEDSESVEKLHDQLAAALAAQPKRFVVLIDDIDRLAPDEALAMFRLVKSVGRLPNVIYVLAFDRILAERVVAERFPSEGPHYLEKIVQASFELPAPLEEDLHQNLLNTIHEITGGPGEKLLIHYMNMFHEIVAGEIRTPRDAIRYANALSITWPAVAEEVDIGDFIALEAYRLFRPGIYQAIRGNPQILCGSGRGVRSVKAEDLDKVLLSSVSDTTRYRKGLQRLFPKLEATWGNLICGIEDAGKQRRACSEKHFQTYFRLSVGPKLIPARELREFIANAGDPALVSAGLKSALEQVHQDFTTKASTLLNALIEHADEIELGLAVPFLKGVFAVADDLDVPGDQARGFDVGSNDLRVHWLMRALLMDRTTLEQRSGILLAANDGAQLGWKASLATSAWQDYYPREGQAAEPETNCLLTLDDLAVFREVVLAEIRQAAAEGVLTDQRDLGGILYRWRDLGDDEGAEVQAWVAGALETDHGVARLAHAFTSHSWGQSADDLVAQRVDRAQIRTLEAIMDVARFLERIAELDQAPIDGANPDRAAIRRFADALRSQEAGPW